MYAKRFPSRNENTVATLATFSDRTIGAKLIALPLP
jgi:hypothetical protein